MKHIEIKKNRVFFNVANGCDKFCKYCYIVELGYKNIELSKLSGKKLFSIISNNEIISTGKLGDLFSFSPHTEPLLNTVIDKTFDWIENISPLLNPIQIATKMTITENIAYRISKVRKYNKQITVFISTSSITYANKYEPNVDILEKRLDSIKTLEKYDIPYFLYIKPILPKITILDKFKYAELINKFNIKGCVIGIYYSNDKINKKAKININLKLNQDLNLALPTGNEIDTIPAGLSELDNMYNYLSEKTNCLILKSSPCAIANVLDSYSPTLTWIRFPELCVNCKECNKIYNNKSKGSR